jgi:hypothetical protein
MDEILNNGLADGLAWAEGYSLALSLLFFLPAIIAFLRGHPRRWGIVILLLTLGWTVVGWLVALIWCLSATRR